MSELIQNLLSRYEDLKAQKDTYTSTWDDIGRYIQLSNITMFGENPKGSNDNAATSYDSTAPYAAQRLAAVINSVMTNPATEWFQLETDNEALNKVKQVKQWLEQATDIIRKELENSNFYTELLTLYYDLATLGTGVMYIEDDTSAERELRFSTRHLKESNIDEDKYGQVDTMFRSTKMTARQMVQRWDDDVSDVVKGVVETKPDTEYEILHAVFPREERDTTQNNPQNFKYASIWVDVDNIHILSESGYKEFPYVVPRWDKLPGETYGRSPAYIALPDVKTLNAMQETLIKIAQKVAEPPMFVTGDLSSALDMRPAAVNYADTSETQVTPLNLGMNPGITTDLIQMKVDRILEIFYNNQLQVIQKNGMTAEEVRARTDENWRVLGSVFGRLQSELLEKLMARVFSIINTATRLDGTPILPALPTELENQSLRLKYVSQLAKAQKNSEAMGIQSTIQYAMSISQIKPDILDNIDFDAAIEAMADLNGAPTNIIVDKEQVMKLRQQRQQAQQAQQQMMMQQQQAESAKNEAAAGKTIVEARKLNEEEV